VLQCVAVCCSLLQCVAAYCSVLQCVTVCCRVLQRVAMCYSVLQCDAVSCSVLSVLRVGLWPQWLPATSYIHIIYSYIHLYIYIYTFLLLPLKRFPELNRLILHVCSTIWNTRCDQRCGNFHSCMWHASFVCVALLIHTWVASWVPSD